MDKPLPESLTKLQAGVPSKPKLAATSIFPEVTRKDVEAVLALMDKMEAAFGGCDRAHVVYAMCAMLGVAVRMRAIDGRRRVTIQDFEGVMIEVLRITRAEAFCGPLIDEWAVRNAKQ